MSTREGGLMGQLRQLVFEYALKVKSKDDVVEQMLAVLQSAFPVGAGKGAGAGRLAGFDLSPLKALAGGTDLSALADVDALKGLVTQALKVAGPALGGLAGSGSGSPSRAHTVSNRPAPPPVTAGRKGMPRDRKSTRLNSSHSSIS